MDSPQNIDDSEKTPLPHLLPVTVAKKTPRPDAVRRVSKWVLFNASVLAFSLTVVYALYLFFHVPCSQSQLTDAEDAVANALAIMMTCCIALAAPAAAVLALRLPCCRPWVRRALAYLALAFTIVGHGLMAHLLLVADPGNLFFRILSIVGIFVYAAGDIISFLVLLLSRKE